MNPLSDTELAAVEAWPEATVPGSSGHLVGRLVANVRAARSASPGPAEAVQLDAPAGPLTGETVYAWRVVTGAEPHPILPSGWTRFEPTIDAERLGRAIWRAVNGTGTDPADIDRLWAEKVAAEYDRLGSEQ